MDYDKQFPHNEAKRLRDREQREDAVLRLLAEQPRRCWFRPMDVGGRDGSHHSYTLKRLVKKGFAEMRPRGTLINSLNGGLSSFEYRASLRGRTFCKQNPP